MDANSCSVVILLLSPFVKDLDAYATGSCSPFLF